MPPRRRAVERARRPGHQDGQNADPNADPNRQDNQNAARPRGNQRNPQALENQDGGQAPGGPQDPNGQRAPGQDDGNDGANRGDGGRPDGGAGVNQNVQNPDPNANPVQPGQRQLRTVMAFVTPGPVTADSPVFLRSNDPLVLKTPFLGWSVAPGVLARVSLASFQMFKVFATRCRIGSQDGDREAASPISVLQLRLTEDAWSRVLSCLVDNGLLRNDFRDLPTLMDSISCLLIPDITSLEIGAADWASGENFSVPAPPDAQAIALQPLAYLSYVTVSLLESDVNTLHPWGDLCYMAGALGPCLTQQARAQPTSSVQLISQKLRVFLGGSAISDGAAARGLGDALPDLRLPSILQSASVKEADLRLEFIDAIQYYAASAAGRATIEARRVFLLGAR